MHGVEKKAYWCVSKYGCERVSGGEWQSCTREFIAFSAIAISFFRWNAWKKKLGIVSFFMLLSKPSFLRHVAWYRMVATLLVVVVITFSFSLNGTIAFFLDGLLLLHHMIIIVFHYYFAVAAWLSKRNFHWGKWSINSSQVGMAWWYMQEKKEGRSHSAAVARG